MDLRNQEKLPVASLMHSANAERDEAQENLEHCLTGLDQTGEAGLQKALDRIYPRTGIVRKSLGGEFSESYARYDYRYPADGSIPKTPQAK